MRVDVTGLFITISSVGRFEVVIHRGRGRVWTQLTVSNVRAKQGYQQIKSNEQGNALGGDAVSKAKRCNKAPGSNILRRIEEGDSSVVIGYPIAILEAKVDRSFSNSLFSDWKVLVIRRRVPYLYELSQDMHGESIIAGVAETASAPDRL